MALATHIDNNTTFINELFNLGIKSFGYEKVATIINSFYNHYKLPIVSVGSGIGAIEYFANNKYYKKYNNNMNWICIDINNNPIHFPSNAHKYINQPLTNIDYNSCDELIKNDPSIVGNCILFLNWCLPNDSTYDYEAIVKLKPKAVLSIYEVFYEANGCAGGQKFFDWTVNSDKYNLKEMYKLYHEDYNEYEDEKNDFRIGWWDINSKEDAVIIHLPCMYYKKQGMCVIQ
jgi:hypothetical protein